jgi:hypothetical protein
MTITPLFSRSYHCSQKRLLVACLLLCPGLAIAAAFTPVTEELTLGALASGVMGDRWCLLYRPQASLQILDGNACDRPQAGLLRQFD